MIEFRRVRKTYGIGPVQVTALDRVSFHIAKGEFVLIAGRSGAGKTTLLRLLYREEVPSEGDVEVLGRDVPGLGRRGVAALRRSIGVVFQDPRLLPGRTVFENVAFVLRVTGVSHDEITVRTFEALRAVGLSARARAYPSQLSQGEAQRASLARAIARRPALLITDEPTGNLDDDMAAEILDLLGGIGASGATVLLATHQMRLVERLRRRTLVLERGRLARDGG